MAVVYLGHDLRHGRDVAIKVLLPELAASVSPERFTREIRIAAGLQHPMILPLFDSGESEGFLFYVMPYVQGESLGARLNRDGPFSVEEACRLGREVAEALSHAHSQGIVHRDIKPDNILLSGGHPLLADFGVARAVSMDEASDLTGTGLLLGSPRYMSPEQAGSEETIDGRADVYALGCVVYEMLAGKPPFDSDNLPALLIKHLDEPPPNIIELCPEVTPALRNTIETALAKDPADRFQDAADFAEALRAPETLTVRAPTLRRKRPSRRTVIGAFIGVAILAATAWTASRDWRAPAQDRDLVAIVPFDAEASLTTWSDLVGDLVNNLDGAGPLRAIGPVDPAGWTGAAGPPAAIEFARDQGAGIGVYGTVRTAGPDSVRLAAGIVEVATGATVSQVELVTDANRRDLGLHALTIHLLRGINSVRPLGVVQVQSFLPVRLSAVKAYLRGEQYFRRTAWDSAGALFEQAVEVDPTFALALRRVFHSRLMQGTGTDSLIWNFGIRAGDLKDGLGPREQLLLTADSLAAGIMKEQWQPADGILASRLERLFSVLDEATRSFPADAEVWFQTGLYRQRPGFQIEAAFDAFENAIEFDPGFGPALLSASIDAMLVSGPEATRRYLNLYFETDPIGSHSDGLRLASRLLDPTADTVATNEIIRNATALQLHQAMGPMQWWPDENHTMVRLAGELYERPHDPRVIGEFRFVRVIYSTALAWRGRLREVEALNDSPDTEERARTLDTFGTQMLMLGDPSPTLEAAVDAALGLEPDARPSWRLAFVVPWLAAVGDTTRINDVVSRVVTDPPPADSLPEYQYLLDQSRAYLSLARLDSVAALSQFTDLEVPERWAPLGLGEWDRYQTIRLLTESGQFDAAATRLDRERRGAYFALDVLLMLERGRVAEARGDTESAIAAYEVVADAWARADPQLMGYTQQATEALTRLGVVR